MTEDAGVQFLSCFNKFKTVFRGDKGSECMSRDRETGWLRGEGETMRRG